MNLFTKTTITVAILFFIAVPYSAQAQTPTIAVNFSGCIVGGVLAPTLQNLISGWMDDLENGLRSIASRFGLNIPGLGGAGIGGTVPVSDEGVRKATGALLGKEQRSDVIARCLGQEVLNGMIKGIVDNARTGGRDGGVTWVRNWRNFQLEAQHRGEGVFRGMLASSKMCNYFDSNLKNTFGANRRVPLTGVETRANDFDSFALRTGCTLPSDFDFEKYKQDFSGNGGWEAWSRLLEPENNFYGAFFQSLDEANKQRAIEESSDLSQVTSNAGFVGRSGADANDSCLTRGANGKCVIYKDIKTPGGVIRASVDATFMQELERFNNVDELGELISSVTTVLIHRLLDLSDPNEGNYTAFSTTLPPSSGGIPSAPEEGIPSAFGSVTVSFEIINDGGGTATANDFQLLIDGELTAIGIARVLPVGEHVVSSLPPDGYSFVSSGGDCNGGILNLAENQSATCTITYDDI